MGELFTVAHLAIILVMFCIFLPIVILPYWQIFEKAGFAPALRILILFPLINLIVLYYVAFSDWKTA
jgi:Kef-type K+ transport system membrane component KefB